MINGSLSDVLGADLTTLREHNSRRVLDALLSNNHGLTQSDIVSRTELSRSTVSSLLGDLAGVLVREDDDEADRGRPAKLWRIDPTCGYSLGIDVGQTHVTVAITDPFGRVLGTPVSEPATDVFERPHPVLNRAADMVEQLIANAHIDCDDIAALTIGLPGPVDASTGVMTDDATRAWAGIDVREEVRKRWPHEAIPAVLADNDANLAAVAEYRFGAGRGAQNLIFIKWSTGIGSGLMLGSQPWRGHAGIAGELGHVPVNATPEHEDALKLPPPHRRDGCARCGQTSCLERVASGRTVAAAVGLPDLTAVIREALDDASPQHAAARAALSAAATLIGNAIGPAITLLNLQRVIIGGLAGRHLYPLIVEDLTRGIEATAFPPARIDASLAMGTLGREAAVRGAAVLGFQAHGPTFLLCSAPRRAAARELSETLTTAP